MDSLIKDMARRHFEKLITVKQAFLNDPGEMGNLVEVAKLCIECYRRGNKILIAGNGGSAADAQHFAGELVSRFNFDRPPLSAIALTTDTSVLTSIGNDYGYEQVFTRQIKANAAKGDIYIALTTSGKSPNILNSLKEAKTLDVRTVGLTGKTGAELDELCDIVIRVPSDSTPEIQEVHISVIHLICEAVERVLFSAELEVAVDNEYALKKEKEINNFKNIENIHALPEIFHYWSNKYLLPNFISSGFSSIEEFYARNLVSQLSDNQRFLSIGAGYCDLEIRIAKLIKQAGLKNFKFECLELNPHLLKRGREMAQEENLTDCMVFTEDDFNSWVPKSSYNGIMANHSLHHVVNLEKLFDNIYDSLDNSSSFVTSDMIGKNGHQRWPEALEIVNRFWHELPERYRYNQLLKRVENEYVNWDCSSESFEGIRAQDILRLLIERFNFKYFYGFLNVLSPFIDRAFGHNFDANSDWDKDFVDRLHAVDEKGFEAGTLKPTQMLAVMKKGVVSEPLYVRGLSPEKSLRL